MKSHLIFAAKVVAVVAIASRIPQVNGMMSGNKFFK